MPLCPNSPTCLDQLSINQLFCHNLSFKRKRDDLASPRKKIRVPIVGKNEKQASPYLYIALVCEGDIYGADDNDNDEADDKIGGGRITSWQPPYLLSSLH